MAKQKLAQRQSSANGHTIGIGLTGNVGYILITDNNLYPDNDSRSKRHNEFMIPLMTREDLKDLSIAIDEVLKNSK